MIKIPESVEQFHDAGYDAQCTGFAFLKLIGILKKVVTAETMDDSLNILDTENIVKVSRHDTVDNNFDLNIVQEFRNCINFSFAPVDRFRIDQDQEMTFNEFYIITSRDDLMKLKESKFDIRWFGRDPWIVKQSGDQIEFELFMTENEIEFTQKNEMGVVDVPVELSSTNNKRARVDYSDI